MRVFIVHAHHEPTSLNGAMTREATAALGDAGHEVVVSDLYAMGFDPVSDRRNFTTVADPTQLKEQAEESLASAQGGFAPDLQAEMDKLAWCDVVVFQFPIWWLGMGQGVYGPIEAILYTIHRGPTRAWGRLASRVGVYLRSRKSGGTNPARLPHWCHTGSSRKR